MKPLRLFCVGLTAALWAMPAAAGGGLGLPDLTTQMRQQNSQAVHRFRDAAGAGRAARQRLRARRQARERAFREKRRQRRKRLEDAGLLAPKE
ncbi:MAG: hypothetical protein AAF441_22530 [Pseudomonadota bacterium]